MSGPSEFLSRWARRKAEHRQGRETPLPQADSAPAAPGVGPGVAEPLPADPADATASAQQAGPEPAVAGSAAPQARGDLQLPASEAADAAAPPELPPVNSLTPESDFRPFMQAGVDPATRSAALRRLFADPHFNRMDGMDVYIDDYGKPDPIPPAVLRALNQARDLGLFRDDGDTAASSSAEAGRATPPVGASARDDSPEGAAIRASNEKPTAETPAVDDAGAEIGAHRGAGATPPEQTAQASAAAAAPAGVANARPQPGHATPD